MTKKLTILLFLSLLLLPHIAQSEGIPLQKDIFLTTPIFGPEDLPEEITFTLYNSKTATEPLGYQTFQRGQYTVDFEFSKSDGITAGNVARVGANFTEKLDINDDPESASKTKEIWLGFEVAGTEIGNRTKVSNGTLVQLLLASDASIATYLTLAYTGDDNPITTIYKDLPISSLGVYGSQSSLSRYFSAVAARTSDDVIIGPLDVAGSDGQIQYNDGGSTQAGASQFYYDDVNDRVGIGTNTPVNPLQVSGGDGQYAALPDGFHMGIDNAGNTHMELVKLGGTPYVDFLNDNVSDYDARIRLLDDGVLLVEATLKVGGSAGVQTGVVSLGNDTSTNDNVGMFRGTSAGALGGGNVAIIGGYGGVGITAGNANFGSQGTPSLFVNTAGNVGIGTTNLTYKLSVNGSIRAKEIIVDTGWSDFVFDDKYRLPPLAEVEQFISREKHLPGIPTEADVEKNGVTLGNMSSKLLQKIEELTLYVIDLEKKNDSLKVRLTAIEKQFNDQRIVYPK